MEIKKIIDYINRGYIASDTLRAPDVYYFMDQVIDDINDRLQTTFPTFTEWNDFVNKWNAWVAKKIAVPEEGVVEIPFDKPTYRRPPMHPCFDRLDKGLFLRRNDNYDAFPDCYLRSVVALGTALKFYVRDEEGEQIALDYQMRYENALFKMVRDYHNQVPWYFQNRRGGFTRLTYEHEDMPWDLVPRGVVLDGDDTRIL